MPVEVKAEVKIPALEKFFDLIGKAVGRHTKQKYDKMDIETALYKRQVLGNAPVEEIRLIAGAIKESGLEVSTIDYADGKVQITASRPQTPIDISIAPSVNVIGRTQDRLLTQEVRKQENIEQILSITAEELKDEPEVSNRPVDEDWLNRYINFAGDITNKEIQFIWGKVLAGEIKRPETFSLRTLELIRNLNIDEARLIEKIGSFAFSMYGQSAVFHGNREALTNYGISFKQISLLIEIGILQAGFGTIFRLHPYPGHRTPIFYGNYYMIVEKLENAMETQLPVHIFTTAGNQILSLVKRETNFKYLHEIAAHMNMIDNSLKYMDLNESKDGSTTEANLKPFDFSGH